MAYQSSMVPNQPLALMASNQPVPQTIIVSYPKKSNRREHFKHRHSMIIGILLIVSGSIAIVMNGVGFWTRIERQSYGGYYGEPGGGQGFIICSGVWTAPMVYLAGSFAIVSAKTKRVGFIVTTLIMSILTAVFTASVISMAAWVVAWDDLALRGNFNMHKFVRDERDEELVLLRKTSLALGAVMMLCGLVEFVSSIVLSALCCWAVCCCNNVPESEVVSSQVVFLNSGNQMMTVSNPHGIAGPTFPEQIPQASGGYLPPSYSTSEINKVGLEEGGECPAKTPIPV